MFARISLSRWDRLGGLSGGAARMLLVSAMLLVGAIDPATSLTAHAAVEAITVNIADDSDDGSCDALGSGTDCTLREAIIAARDNGNETTIRLPRPWTLP